MIHGKRKNGLAHGIVNTKLSVVTKMLDLVDYKESRNLSLIRVLEPSAGEGAFAIEIINRLYKSSIRYDFDFLEALSNIYLCELNEEIFEKLKNNLLKVLAGLGVFDDKTNYFLGDFLQLDIKDKFDLIIGNPPYVRNENIPENLKPIYQNSFSTFSHRSDLYIPFYEKALNLLNRKGVLSYICSNRWLKNQYGKKLRDLVAKHYRVDCIIDLENVDVFDEQVLGYPAITNISKNNCKKHASYFRLDSLQLFLDFEIGQSIEKSLNLSSSNWFSFSYTGALYEKNLATIENQNFKIGIGVATGRDSIFISKDLKGQVEDDLLIPLLTAKDVKGSKISWNGNYLINPFDRYGRLIELINFPKAMEYFTQHKNELSKRHISKKDPSKWYRTIDKVHFNVISKPKVILPDISGNRIIHVDKGDFYPHHNLYYITGGNYEEMCIIASILMSDFVYEQLLEIGNKMNGGYPRWQSQNLRKLLIPYLTSIPQNYREALLNAYHQKDLSGINNIINKQKISEFQISEGQLTLFEPKLEYKNNDAAPQE